jgi:hypothetical protein
MWYTFLAFCKETKGTVGDANRLKTALPKCFDLSLPEQLKPCYENLARILQE